MAFLHSTKEWGGNVDPCAVTLPLSHTTIPSLSHSPCPQTEVSSEPVATYMACLFTYGILGA